MSTKSLDTLTHNTLNTINQLYAQASSLPLTSRLLLLGTLVITPGLYFLNAAVHNYKLYMSLGPGGVAYGVRGWLFNWMLMPLGNKDLIDTKRYDNPKLRKQYGDMGSRSFLREDNEKGQGLVMRKGERPEVPRFAAPQRQLPGTGNNGRFVDAQTHIFHNLVQQNPTLFYISTSGQEKRGPALFLTSYQHAPEPVDGHTHGEIAHLHVTSSSDSNHEVDGSAHVTLSLEDAKEVVHKGWGQRHLMSGRLGARIVGEGFTMLYAPRDEAEVEVMSRIVRAGAKYMTGGKDINF